MIIDIDKFRNSHAKKLHELLMNVASKVLFYVLKKYNPDVRSYDSNVGHRLKHIHRFDIGKTIVRLDITTRLDD